jgi:hypothetical protein
MPSLTAHYNDIHRRRDLIQQRRREMAERKQLQQSIRGASPAPSEGVMGKIRQMNSYNPEAVCAELLVDLFILAFQLIFNIPYLRDKMIYNQQLKKELAAKLDGRPLRLVYEPDEHGDLPPLYPVGENGEVQLEAGYNRVFMSNEAPADLANRDKADIFLVRNGDDVVAHYNDGVQWCEKRRTLAALQDSKIYFEENTELTQSNEIEKITSLYGCARAADPITDRNQITEELIRANGYTPRPNFFNGYKMAMDMHIEAMMGGGMLSPLDKMRLHGTTGQENSSNNKDPDPKMWQHQRPAARPVTR